MPLTWSVDTGPATTFVSVEGAPSTGSMTALRTVLAAHATRRRAPLLISLSGGATTEPRLFSLIAALADCPDTPPVPIVLQSEDDDPGRPRMPMCRALAAAQAALLGEPSPDRTGDEQLLPVAGASRRGRDVATEACVRWDQPHLIGPAAMAVSELTSYATRHAGTMMNLTIATTPASLYLAVHHGRLAVRPGRPPGADPTDRELLLISAIAGCWGFLPDGPDTIFWAAVPAGSPGRLPAQRTQPILLRHPAP